MLKLQRNICRLGLSALSKMSEEGLELLYCKIWVIRKRDIAKLDLANMTSKEFQELIAKKYREMLTGNGSRQKVIPLSELENYILQGWEFATSIPDNKAVIKLPS